MRRLILLGVAVWMLAADTEARDWGFSRDTVYTSYHLTPAMDTTWLVNRGSDTLRLDSMFAENINVLHDWAVSFSLHMGAAGLQSQRHDLWGTIPVDVSWAWLAPGDSLFFRRMMLGTPCPTAKISELPTTEDSIMVRVRLRTMSLQEDTVIVAGRYCGVSLRWLPHTNQAPRMTDGPRDILGRKRVPAGSFPALTLPNR